MRIKMKKLMIVLVVAVTSTQVWAAGLGGLTDGSTDQTPFQKMEALYNAAQPMQLSQFLNATDPEVQNWDCAGVTPTMTAAQVAPFGRVPVLEQGTVVVSPAVPSSGPLFPGSPEQDQAVQEVALISNDGSWSMTPEEVGVDYTSGEVQLVTSPGVSETILNSSDSPAKATMNFRIGDNLIFVQQESSDPTLMAALYNYFYCYKK
jgi:hypothetical protein